MARDQSAPWLHLLLIPKRIEMLLAPDIQGIVRNGRRRRYALAEARVPGNDVRLVRPGLQDSDGAVIERREVNVAVDGDRRGVVAAGGGSAFMDVDILARPR